jgi:hypothetical protein
MSRPPSHVLILLGEWLTDYCVCRLLPLILLILPMKLILDFLQHRVLLLHLPSPLIVLHLEDAHLTPELLLSVSCTTHGLFQLEMLDLQLTPL